MDSKLGNELTYHEKTNVRSRDNLKQLLHFHKTYGD